MDNINKQLLEQLQNHKEEQENINLKLVLLKEMLIKDLLFFKISIVAIKQLITAIIIKIKFFMSINKSTNNEPIANIRIRKFVTNALFADF